MATTAEINALVDMALAAGFNVATGGAFLKRAKLEAELTELQSLERKLRAQQARATDAFNDALALNQAAQQAKTTAIDAL
jgi:hypothetical protein